MHAIRSRRSGRLIVLAAASTLFGSAATQAYVDLAPTLGKIVADSKSIAFVEVAAFDASTQTVTLKPLRTLKGDTLEGSLTNRVAAPGGVAAPAVHAWAQPGSRGVWFATPKIALVCTGRAWYQIKRAGDEPWRLGVDRPDLPLAYCGAPARLAAAVERMLAGEEAIIASVVYGATDVDTSFDLALGRTNLPGLARVQRTRASLAMPGMVAAASDGNYVVGPGPVDAADLPKLRQALRSNDAAVRSEAAESIGQIGATAREAVRDLNDGLTDAEASIRTAAASALIRLTGAGDASERLRQELRSPDPAARRAAANGVALAGPAAAALSSELVPLLGDKDDGVRVAAMQAVTTLGPLLDASAAAAAVGVLTPMLQDAAWRVEAADALGRLGKAARPAPAGLVAMLADAQPSVRWAGVRALAQIGGPEARPAVDLIKEKLPTGSEVEQYNMMIYAALLGPEAADVAPVLRSTRLKNPVLPGATLWAIGDTTRMPWLGNERRGPGGSGGPDGGGPADINRYMYSAFFRELGDRLRPAAAALARQLLDGTAGDVPEWGYGLLAADTNGSLAILSPRLTDADRQVRQRAIVALGYMGPAAEGAKPQVEAALAGVSDDGERRMLGWCLRKLARVE